MLLMLNWFTDMKRVLVAFLIFLGISFVNTSPVFAGCDPNGGPAALCGTRIPCSVSLTKNYCCDTQAECDVLKGSAPSDPTCDSGKGINTAIGCIPALNTKEAFLGFVLKWAVGIGGGIAFLLIIYAGFMIMTAAGNPERIKAGQELLTSAISGLILLIFSIFILRIIGIDILKLPGFGS